MSGGSQFDVVVVGSANLDLVATAIRLPAPGETVSGYDFFEAPGGKGANQAVAAARVGARVAFVGAVGEDHAGVMLREVLTAEGIDVSGMATVDAPTGRALIGVADSGENSIIVVPGANGLVDVELVDRSAHLIAGAGVVACQCEVSLAAVAHAFGLADADARRMLNPAPAPLQFAASLVSLVDLLVPNEHEAELLGGVAPLLALGVGDVVVTEGSRGATWHTRSGIVPIAPYRVTPVDTTGAGDAFCGALAARLALGDPMEDALRAASAAGALATTRSGAIPSLPPWAEIERLISGAD